MSGGSLSCPGMQDYVSVIAKSIRSCCGTEGMSDLMELEFYIPMLVSGPLQLCHLLGRKF